jgi:hypothetical protein
MKRICRRNACPSPASASLTFRYDTAQAWLQDLLPSPNPQQWDLCPDHAAALTVPRGWELVDARSAAGKAATSDDDAEPDRAGGSGRHRGSAGPVSRSRQRPGAEPRRNRYAELSARLPELAAGLAAASPLVTVGSARRHGDPLPLEAAQASR